MVDVISDTIDYQNEVGRREEQATHNAQESVNRQAWSTILDHWDVSEYEANYTVVRDWCNGEITVEKFQALLETNPPGLTLDWKGTRNKIIQEIAGLLEDPTGRRMTALDLKKAVASMQYWPCSTEMPLSSLLLASIVGMKPSLPSIGMASFSASSFNLSQGRGTSGRTRLLWRSDLTATGKS